MKAIVQSEYGSADVLRLEELEKPVVADNEVLVRVRGAGVHAGDWHLMRGDPFFIRLIFGGLLKPKVATIGTDVAGQVEAVGKDVKQFQPGEEVFGDLSECGFGAFSEYVSVPETALAHKPANLSFEEAATVPVSGLAALQALRDYGEIQPGQRVLINGASGGVGSFAVQLAKGFGAEVTAVCSTGKVKMVKSLGADYIVDYTQSDPTQPTQPYELIVDAAAYRPFSDFLGALAKPSQGEIAPGGTYVMVGGATSEFFRSMLLGSFVDRFKAKASRRQVKCLVSKPNQADLTVLKDWIEAGKLKPFVDRAYPLADVPTAIRHVEERRVKGKVAISVS
ncbi:MAG: NAD(P)-dependent alcohol dehydrogenase [Cyanobacteria bacterium J06560_6]